MQWNKCSTHRPHQCTFDVGEIAAQPVVNARVYFTRLSAIHIFDNINKRYRIYMYFSEMLFLLFDCI